MTGLGPIASLPLASLLVTPAIFISAQSTDPIYVQSFQYDDNAAQPVLVPAAEVVTPDKWDRGQSLPLPRPQLRQDGNGVFIAVIAPPVQEIYIGAQPTEPIAVQNFQYPGEAPRSFVITAPENVTLDKWDRGQSLPLPRPRLRQDANGSFVVVVTAPPPSTAIYINAQSP